MKRILLALLLLVPLQAHAAAEFFTFLLIDDMGTWGLSANHAALVGDAEPDFMPYVTDPGGVVIIATPNMDTIAAGGFSHGAIRSAASVCTPARATLFDYGPVHAPTNLYGRVKGPTNAVTDYEINPGYKNLFRSAQDAGYTVAFFGKLHLAHWWVADSTKVGTFAQALGIDYGEAIGIANIQNDLPGYDYPGLEVPYDYDACGGSHNYYILTDLAGNVTVHTDYSTDTVFDAATAYMAAQTTGKHFVIISPWAPHAPWVVPSDPLGCGASTPEKSDLPPGSTANDKYQLYRDAIQYIDTKFADVIAEVSYTTDTICIVADNGVPGQIATGLSPECNQSPGAKSTPYRCGTSVPFMCKGPGIAVGAMSGTPLTGGMNAMEDIPPTLLQLMGGNSPNGHGMSFADCMTESNLQTAASCRHVRDVNLWWEWEPIGGTSSGRLSRMPDPDNTHVTEAAGEWTSLEVSVETYLNSEEMLLHRIYDTTVSPMTFYELLWPIDPADQDGRYVDEAAGELATTAAPDGGLIDCSTLNAVQETNCELLHKTIADVLARGGVPAATFGGASF